MALQTIGLWLLLVPRLASGLTSSQVEEIHATVDPFPAITGQNIKGLEIKYTLKADVQYGNVWFHRPWDFVKNQPITIFPYDGITFSYDGTCTMTQEKLGNITDWFNSVTFSSEHFQADLNYPHIVKPEDGVVTWHCTFDGNTSTFDYVGQQAFIQYNSMAEPYTWVHARTVVAPVNGPAASCFPGEATVDSTALFTYKSGLGWLHALHGPASFLTLEHQWGELRASDNHLLFNGEGLPTPAKLFVPGDDLLLGTGVRSRVLGIRMDTTAHGMFAPLTASGLIIVDGTMASNYATVGKLSIPHSAMHASFMFARMFPMMQGKKATASETVNPLVHIFQSILKLDKLLGMF